jgi:D-serine deaminase-like pyridoxal phosphate-dependent protein
LDRLPERLTTPAALVDLGRMEANLDRMAAYARTHGLALRPHTKTHKSTRLAREQLARHAAGLTVATTKEAETMRAVAADLLLAHPPVGAAKLRRAVDLARAVRLTVALDSRAALRALDAAAGTAGVRIGVLIELDVGMRRVGIADPTESSALALLAAGSSALEFRGLTCYPGHVREPVAEQAAALRAVAERLAAHLDALRAAGLEATVVSGGSTPTAYATHTIAGLTEFRPGTYIFNDRTTAAIGACAWEDCAYSVLATVVSTAVPGQAVVDAGSKALAREEIRGDAAPGFGALLDRPDVVVGGLSEEHGILDLSHTDWRPRVGERVRIVPNHVCVSVNLQNRVWAIRDGEIVDDWPVEARGWND